jgi:hypothetical protein
MNICKQTKWLCENAKSLEKFAGQLVAFSATRGIVGRGESFDSIFNKSSRPKKSTPAPYVFHVPSKEELASPIPVVKKK